MRERGDTEEEKVTKNPSKPSFPQIWLFTFYLKIDVLGLSSTG